MKKSFIFSLILLILFSGCVSEKSVKTGDKISVDYTGTLEDGTFFDTSIESVAIANNVFTPGREYTPLQINVGKKEVISGFEEGIIGMKVGESKTLIIPPEKGYGPINPDSIKTLPIIETIPTRLPRVIEIPRDQFESTFGTDHQIGDIVTPNPDVSFTVQEINNNVSLSLNINIGDEVPAPGAPWKETVVDIDDENITVNYHVEINETVQFQNVVWNTTVKDVNKDNLILKHNAIPETEITTMYGPIKVSFNETSIIMDHNHKLAGKTLIFNITLRSIDN